MLLITDIIIKAFKTNKFSGYRFYQENLLKSY